MDQPGREGSGCEVLSPLASRRCLRYDIAQRSRKRQEVRSRNQTQCAMCSRSAFGSLVKVNRLPRERGTAQPFGYGFVVREDRKGAWG